MTMRRAFNREICPASRLKKRHVQRETRLPTNFVALHVSNMKIRPQVMHRFGCIDCGQVGGRQKFLGTPRQPSDFKANCTVSATSAGTKVGQVGARPLVELSACRGLVRGDCSPGAQDSCHMKRPVGPLGCRVISRAARTELVTGRWSLTAQMPITKTSWCGWQESNLRPSP
jgi:hypothetical protein